MYNSCRLLISLIFLLEMCFFDTNVVDGANNAYLNSIVKPDRVYSYDDMINDISLLEKQYGYIINVDTIGYSVEGRAIPVVRLGRGEHKIFVCGAMHAREYISATYLMNYIDTQSYLYYNYLSSGGFDPQVMLSKVTFYIVPMVNPDGVNIVQYGFDVSTQKDSLEKMNCRDNVIPEYRCWKSNAHGVDINRNFDYGWDTGTTLEAPASNSYKGSKPLSEPETKALAEYLITLKPEAVLSFHTQGRTLYLSTPDELSKSIAKRIMKSTGFSKEEISSPYGSFQDFVDHNLNVFYACVELCPYVGPYPFDDNRFYEVWQESRFICSIVADEVITNDKK